MSTLILKVNSADLRSKGHTAPPDWLLVYPLPVTLELVLVRNVALERSVQSANLHAALLADVGSLFRLDIGFPSFFVDPFH
jgi:hypothetical protein